MQKAKGGSVVVEGFLNDLLSNFKTLTEISRKFIFSTLLFIAYFYSYFLYLHKQSNLYPSSIYRFQFSHSQLFIL